MVKRLFHTGLEYVEYVLFHERSPCFVETFVVGNMLCHFCKAAFVDAHFRKRHRNAYIAVEVVYGFDGRFCAFDSEHVLAELLYALHHLCAVRPWNGQGYVASSVV